MKEHFVFFDWDGTLADSMDVCVQGIKLALSRMQLPCPADETIRLCNGPAYDACIGILGVPQSVAKDFLLVRSRAEMEVLDSVQRLFPGIEEMLGALAAEAKLCIVSNGLQEYLDRSLVLTGIGGYFTRAQARIRGLDKTEVLRNLLLEYQPESAVMIGDCACDIEAGRKNGLRTIGAAYGYGKKEEWSSADDIAWSVGDVAALARRQARDFL